MPAISPPMLAGYIEAERTRHPAIYGELQSSSQSGEQRIDLIFLDQLLKTSDLSTYHTLEHRYALLFDELASLRSLTPNWDTYGAAPPSDRAIQDAQTALSALRLLGAQPSAIRPSAEGGIGICFTADNAYAHLEFLNDGEVHALAYSAQRQPESWQIDPVLGLAEAWNRIRADLQS